jgi:hypothetical protein
MANRLRLGTPIAGKVDLLRAERAGEAVVVPDTAGLKIVTPAPAWAFAAAILISHAPNDPPSVMVEIDVAEADGPVAFTFVTIDMRRDVAQSVGYEPGRTEPVRCLLQNFHEAGWLLVRNGGIEGRPTRLTLNEVRFFPAASEPLPEVADVQPGRVGRVDLALLASIADAVDRPWSPLEKPEPLYIDAVPVELLGERLGFAEPFDPAKASRKPLPLWRMEDDDQPIFRYLYRGFKPRRHLEFGTWYGAGTVYCLEECDATVWTLNLPQGERRADGKAAYGDGSSAGGASDSGAAIGRLYLEADLGHRVCQIYCDTRKWDIGNYPSGFFESVLVDGGHQADVVVSDTMKAIELLRPGGLCLWHDFAADPAVFAASPASIGVTQGIRAAWPEISAAMRDVFWIYPSFILAGIRR